MLNLSKSLLMRSARLTPRGPVLLRHKASSLTQTAILDARGLCEALESVPVFTERLWERYISRFTSLMPDFSPSDLAKFLVLLQKKNPTGNCPRFLAEELTLYTSKHENFNTTNEAILLLKAVAQTTRVWCSKKNNEEEDTTNKKSPALAVVKPLFDRIGDGITFITVHDAYSFFLATLHLQERIFFSESFSSDHMYIVEEIRCLLNACLEKLVLDLKESPLSKRQNTSDSGDLNLLAGSTSPTKTTRTSLKTVSPDIVNRICVIVLSLEKLLPSDSLIVSQFFRSVLELGAMHLTTGNACHIRLTVLTQFFRKTKQGAQFLHDVNFDHILALGRTTGFAASDLSFTNLLDCFDSLLFLRKHIDDAAAAPVSTKNNKKMQHIKNTTASSEDFSRALDPLIANITRRLSSASPADIVRLSNILPQTISIENHGKPVKRLLLEQLLEHLQHEINRRADQFTSSQLNAIDNVCREFPEWNASIIEKHRGSSSSTSCVVDCSSSNIRVAV